MAHYLICAFRSGNDTAPYLPPPQAKVAQENALCTWVSTSRLFLITTPPVSEPKIGLNQGPQCRTG